MKIIPAIDLLDGKVTRLKQGRYEEANFYEESAAEFVKKLMEEGLEHLHLVDLSAAKRGAIGSLDQISALASSGIQIDYGGGIRSLNDIEKLLGAGVQAVNLGSIQFKDSALFQEMLKEFGSHIIVSIDVQGSEVMYQAWQKGSGRNWQNYLPQIIDWGVERISATDVSKDGMMEGPGFDLYREMQATFPSLKIIASGGVSSLVEVQALRALGLEGAIIGKAWLDGKIQLAQLC